MSTTNSAPSSRVASRGFGRRFPEDRGASEKPADRKKTISRLIRYFRPELPMVISLMLTTVLGVVASVVAPALQSSAIDAISSTNFGIIPRTLFGMAAAYLLYGISLLIQGYISAALSQRIIRKLRNDLFGKIVDLPLRYLDSHSHGDIMSRLTNDAENISDVISSSLYTMFSGILTLIGTIAFMLYYNVPLTLLSCLTIIAVVAVITFLGKYMSRFYVRRQILLGAVNEEVEEKVTDFRTVTAYNQQEAVIADFEKESDSLCRTGVIADVLGGSIGPVMNMLNNCTFVIVAVFGAWFAVRGYITIGVISAFIIYAKQFSRPINDLAQLYGQIETALAGAECIFILLDEPGEDKSGTVRMTSPEGVIEFRHVNFSYVPGKQVIHDFSLKVDKGRKIALVGSTGSGKTTIINLLMRFYDVDSGEITLDGVNIHDINCSDLRNDIGIVLQDTVLFTDTVRNNLEYGAGRESGDSPVSGEALHRAARMSNCDTVVESLPDGYDTVLVQAGASLSQGQRQLLAIGRAFLSDPRILILDEATSSVDTRTEKKIQDAMVNLMKNRTSLIIAHRLSTIQDADEIVVMDHGRIVETGSHTELLAARGAYYRLYMTQFAGKAT